MGLADKILAPVRGLLAPQMQANQSYKTFTEYAPSFSPWDGNLYEQAQTRAIVERIAVACSKLKPEFVTPDGSGGALPRVQRMFRDRPNDMMSWPDLLRRLATLLYVDTTTYVIPQYDKRDGGVIGLWPLKPSYAEVLEYLGEPWIRFVLINGDVMAFPFYDVAILTRFQMMSDVFGGGNLPLTPTLRLMDAQRQAEEIALQTGADIRFIGKVSGIVHDKHLAGIRDNFADMNLNPARNPTGLMLYDATIEDIQQIKNQSYTIDPDEMERIDKALYTYFGINEAILTNQYDEATWAAFYEGVVEPFALMLASRLTNMLLTPTQVRNGNHVMFSAGYLEYATPDSKLKVVANGMDRGIYTVNEAREVFNLPSIVGGNIRLIRGEYYGLDDENNIVTESGGHDGQTAHQINESDTDVDDTDDGESGDWDTTVEQQS